MTGFPARGSHCYKRHLKSVGWSCCYLQPHQAYLSCQGEGWEDFVSLRICRAPDEKRGLQCERLEQSLVCGRIFKCRCPSHSAAVADPGSAHAQFRTGTVRHTTTTTATNTLSKVKTASAQYSGQGQTQPYFHLQPQSLSGAGLEWKG